jgi:transposase-like protein
MLHELYESGLSIVDIGRELGVTAFPMRRILRACGIPIRPRGGRRWFRIEVTDTLLQEVMRDGIGTVAERLGVNPVTLSMRLRKYWREKKT